MKCHTSRKKFFIETRLMWLLIFLNLAITTIRIKLLYNLWGTGNLSGTEKLDMWIMLHHTYQSNTVPNCTKLPAHQYLMPLETSITWVWMVYSSMHYTFWSQKSWHNTKHNMNKLLIPEALTIPNIIWISILLWSLVTPFYFPHLLFA